MHARMYARMHTHTHTPNTIILKDSLSAQLGLESLRKLVCGHAWVGASRGLMEERRPTLNVVAPYQGL